MDIAALTSGATPSANQAAQSLGGDFDNFLKLLTTQLANQDPLAPMDSNEFTAQLVRFTQVEQAIAQNKNLEQLVGLITANQAIAAVNYIGKMVEASGNKNELADGSAKWSYNLPLEAAETTIIVRNSAGSIVYAGTGEKSQGPHVFDWNGKSTQGTDQPEGIYQVTVNAKDAQGAAMTVQTSLIGKVTGVENADGKTNLIIGKIGVPFANVVAVTGA
jgi:flagellar basal-body rod modification protein FlgD